MTQQSRLPTRRSPLSFAALAFAAAVCGACASGTTAPDVTGWSLADWDAPAADTPATAAEATSTPVVQTAAPTQAWQQTTRELDLIVAAIPDDEVCEPTSGGATKIEFAAPVATDGGKDATDTGTGSGAPAAATAADGAGGGHDATALAKQTQNPVANLTSVPVENIWNMNAGVYRRSQFISNVRPVIPVKINEDWNWFHRGIIPLMDQPSVGPGTANATGLGDVTYQGFLSPAKPGKLIWGVGPMITFPTATDDALGTDKWRAGPAIVGLTIDGPWVVGALITQQWQFASNDNDRARVGVGSLQPIINYNLSDGWYLTSTPTITANWKADRGGDVWTVPVGVGVGKVVKIGRQHMNFSVRPYYNVHHADKASNWSITFQVQFLFPQTKGKQPPKRDR